MAKWEELPIADRAQYMRVAVQNGYRDIRSIREAYNKFEGGGGKVGPTYNPETKKWTNSKGQDITGKSFKGQYGTTTYLDSGAVDLQTGYNTHKWRYASNAPRVYIGGTANEARQQYFDKDVELTNTVKKMAKQYGISPNVLASRIAKEGPIDENIRHYNNTNGYYGRDFMSGPVWGLDDLGTMITEGTIKLRPGLQVDTDFEMENEKGRTTYSVASDNFLDGVELTAAALQYFKGEMKKKFPKATNEQLEQYATAAFNMGITGATQAVQKGQIKNAYKPFLTIKKNGGRLYPDGGGFSNPYTNGQKYAESSECAYFSNHTLNDQGYMVSGNAWSPKGVSVIYNGFNGLSKPSSFNIKDYDNYNRNAVQNVYDNFKTRETLDPDSVYPVNMFYAPSPNKAKAYEEGDSVYGTHTGYLSYDKADDTWYVTHNIHGTVHKDKFGALQNSKGDIGVTAIFEPRKNNFLNRAITWLGFSDGGPLLTHP